MLKRFFLFSLVVATVVQQSPAYAAGTVTVINRTNHCVVLEASMFRPSTGGWARPTEELRVDGQARFNFMSAKDMDIRGVVKQTSRCNSGTLAHIGPYKTNVKGDRLKVVRLTTFQIVRD
jgi:hypothetical protein